MKILKVPIILILIFSILLTGCLESRKVEPNFKNQNISILYFDESTFFQLYGDFVRSEFPNINITVIPSKGAHYKNVCGRRKNTTISIAHIVGYWAPSIVS